MATRQIKVVITVQDAASKKMNQVERTMRKTGQAADEASKRFMHFNRTLFTTTAFVGTFVAAFRSLNNVIGQGADFNRLENAFKGIFGPNADVLKMVKGFTDTAVDEMDAMRASIRLSSKDLGLSQGEVSELLARGAVAAKKAGMNAADGAKAIAEAIRTGNIEAADNLNIINKGGVAYKAYEAAIAKASGTMSPAVKIMYRKNLILQALRESTDGYMRGNRDLKDILVTVNNSTRRVTKSLGLLLGKALGPLIDQLANLSEKAAAAIKDLAQNKKLVETAKYITLTTGAVIGLAGALGTLKLATVALGSFTTGFPGLIALLAAGGMMFASLTSKADSLNDKFKTFISFFKGIWQLVSSFDEDTGIGTVDKQIADLMVRMGLMTKTFKDGKVVYDGLIVNVARGTVLVTKFISGMADGIKDAFKAVANVFNTISENVKKVLGLETGPWIKELIFGAKAIGYAFGIVGSVLAGFAALKGGFNLVKGALGFGGKKGKGDSITNPLYAWVVNQATGAAGLLTKIPGVSGLGTILKNFINKFVLSSRLLGEIFTNPKGKLAGLGVVIINALKTGAGLIVKGITAAIPFLGPILAVAAAGAAGMLAGKIANDFIDKYTQGKTEEGFEGNAVERAMFWFDKKTGLLGGEADKFITNQQKMKKDEQELERLKKLKEQAPNVVMMDEYRRQREEADKKDQQGKPSQVTNPRTYKDELAKVDEMAMEMASMEGEKRTRAQKDIEKALAADSEGGAGITQKELNQFRAFLEAINNSEMTKNTKIIADKIDNTNVSGSRRNN